MIITIAIAVGSALLHWLLQRQAAARYEQVMKEAIRAAKSAEMAEEASADAHAMVSHHLTMLEPALAALPKKRAPRKTKAAGIGETEV